MTQATPCQVTKLHYHRQSRQLDISFSDGFSASLSAEFLRVFSPSAEVQGHGRPVLVTNKKSVAITGLIPVGHYAVKLVFDDGHNSGLYSWPYLLQLCTTQNDKWQGYLAQLKRANANRDEVIAVRQR